jgi:hypothetical protein
LYRTHPDTAGVEVLTAVAKKGTISCNLTQCSLLKVKGHFKRNILPPTSWFKDKPRKKQA